MRRNDRDLVEQDGVNAGEPLSGDTDRDGGTDAAVPGDDTSNETGGAT